MKGMQQMGRFALACGFLWLSMCAGLAFAGWERQSSGVGVELRGVAFVNERVGCAVGGKGFTGDSGTIIRTSDGGSDWTVQASPNSVSFLDVDFADSLNGLAVGTRLFGVNSFGYALTTTDGGRTWNTTPETDQDNTWYSSCRLLDNSTQWATYNNFDEFEQAYSGFVDGLCPEESGFSQDFEYFNDVDAVDSATAWVVASDDWMSGEGEVLKTTDRGDTWFVASAGFDSSSGLVRCDFIDRNQGWVVGSLGKVFHTSDGGFNWEKQYDSAQTLADVAFADSLNGWVVGSLDSVHPLVLRTRDGGRNWTAEQVPGSSRLRAVRCLDTNDVWAVGNQGLIVHYSPDAGLTSRSGETPAPAQLRFECAPNPFHHSVRILATASGARPLRIAVYDAAGKKVWQSAPSSSAPVFWSGTQTDGKQCPPGVYLCRAESGGLASEARLVLLR